MIRPGKLAALHFFVWSWLLAIVLLVKLPFDRVKSWWTPFVSRPFVSFDCRDGQHRACAGCEHPRCGGRR